MNTHECWRKCQQAMPEQHQIRSRNRDPFSANTVKNQQPAQFTECYSELSELNTIWRSCLQTSTLFVSFCISDPACSKSYTAKGTTCMSFSADKINGCSGVAQGLYV